MNAPLPGAELINPWLATRCSLRPFLIQIHVLINTTCATFHPGIQHAFICTTTYGHTYADMKRTWTVPIKPQLWPTCQVLAGVQQGGWTRQSSPDSPRTALPHTPLPLAALHSHHLIAAHLLSLPAAHATTSHQFIQGSHRASYLHCHIQHKVRALKLRAVSGHEKNSLVI